MYRTHRPRWEQERVSALKWLVNYKIKHFSKISGYSAHTIIVDDIVEEEKMMIRLMGGTSGGQNWWELVDVSTGKVLLRSWNKEDIVCLYEKLGNR